MVNPHRERQTTARSNIEPAQICLHANGQSAPRSGGARDVGRGAGCHTLSTASGYIHTYIHTCIHAYMHKEIERKTGRQ